MVMNKEYDYLIVGAGLFGAVFSREMSKFNKRCLIIEGRSSIGGNCYTEKKDGIDIHVYGPHIFHTNNEVIWEYVNQFSEFNNYRHSPKVNYNGKIYSFPINLMTLNQLWGVNTPEEAIKKIKEVSLKIDSPRNFEEWILSQVGDEIYEKFIKGYTEKQWGKDPKDLPASIIKRLPIRFSFDDNYFFDSYQGIPTEGYTKLITNIIGDTNVVLNTNYFDNKEYFNSISNKVVFTGKIDEYFNYKFGRLEYRSLEFKNELIGLPDYQGCSIVNYTDHSKKYTRITEHKHFNPIESDTTWITKEYPIPCSEEKIPYYPINDEGNNKLYLKYKLESDSLNNVIFGGRLAEYKYYDMHQVIESAINKANSEKENNP